MYGSRCATACFITRADFTTWGRNMRPLPNRSPTMFMPAINGPSITSSGRTAARRASSTSSVTKSVTPCTNACERRCSTASSRHARSGTRCSLFWSRYRSASASRRSAPSGRRLSTTSSQASFSSGSRSSYTAIWPALTMPMSIPARMAWSRNTECIASRTVSLPRNENDRFDTPPDTCERARWSRIQRVASMNARP